MKCCLRLPCPLQQTSTEIWNVTANKYVHACLMNVFLTSDSFFPNRDHDYRHLPHPVEMGPQESWNSHPDCGEASGAPGHTGTSVCIWLFIQRGHCLVPFCITVTFRFGFRVGSRSFVTGQRWRLSKALTSPMSQRGGLTEQGCEVLSSGCVLTAVGWRQAAGGLLNGKIKGAYKWSRQECAQPHSEGFVSSDNSGQNTVQRQCETCVSWRFVANH